ncbi:hypothetical protein C8J56DRAFT_1031998 [Mycena floridula]|nr:hypothetical protein C8J56DRAFT_1031998 [Mycena floridula]
MKTTLLSSIVVALCAFGAHAAPVEELTNVERSADGGFLATCSDTGVNIRTLVLTSTCGDGHGGEVTSSIGLNSCVANQGGELVARVDGEFSATCSQFGFTGTNAAGVFAVLFAVCGDGHGGEIQTQLDLNTVFTNRNGLLTCP